MQKFQHAHWLRRRQLTQTVQRVETECKKWNGLQKVEIKSIVKKVAKAQQNKMADRLLESNHALVQSLQENTHNKDTSKSTNIRLKVWKFWDLKDKFLKREVPEALNKISEEFYAIVLKKDGKITSQ